MFKENKIFNVIWISIMVLYLVLAFAGILNDSKNGLVFAILLMLFFWKNGIVYTKTKVVLYDPNDLESKKNKKRFNIMFGTWVFFALILFFIANFMTSGMELFFARHKIYVQSLLFVFLIYLLVMFFRRSK